MSKQNTIRWAVLGVLALAGLLIAVYAAMGYGHYHDYDECMYWEYQDQYLLLDPVSAARAHSHANSYARAHSHANGYTHAQTHGHAYTGTRAQREGQRERGIHRSGGDGPDQRI